MRSAKQRSTALTHITADAGEYIAMVIAFHVVHWETIALERCPLHALPFLRSYAIRRRWRNKCSSGMLRADRLEALQSPSLPNSRLPLPGRIRCEDDSQFVDEGAARMSPPGCRLSPATNAAARSVPWTDCRQSNCIAAEVKTHSVVVLMKSANGRTWEMGQYGAHIS